jgi:transcriptional regulator with XRE-family HTH domain
MLYTSAELTCKLAARIKARRLGLGWTQADTAARAGISFSTWRRLENEGKASIEDLVRAAVALRCEQDFATLFPEPPADSMEALLASQKNAAQKSPTKRLRASTKRRAA